MKLVLYSVAAFQAPIIMMGQNRKEEKDRKNNEDNYLFNLKAELEIKNLHQKVDFMVKESFKILFNRQAEQIE